MSIIHTKLRNARLQKGFTQDYMAACLGISQKQYSRLENDNSGLTLDYLEKICKELEIDPQDLFTNDIKQENNNQQGGYSNSAYLIVNQFSEKLVEQYEKRLQEKDDEIKYLRSLIDKG
ncbi:MAG: helix-turn-helix transcriptional regulator [Dysgonamonadaceae bacterium]|jgi:transcriptional regulator with XRE-family HTH domain|nr:helix-turn-helix transcriptional regulator [Dysgonamonadaceae bacterium]